jgi:hypothetical protein
MCFTEYFLGCGQKETLRRRLCLIHFGLQLLTLSRLGRGFLLSGRRESDGHLDVVSWTNVKSFVMPFRFRSTSKVTDALIREAVDIANCVLMVDESSRLSRGIYILEQALRETRLQERLHQLTRSLEALTKPVTGKTRRQFVHRCQTFAVAGVSAAEALRDIYEIRSAVEHVHDGLTVVAGRADKPEDVLRRRLAQVEYLSTRTYARLLAVPSLIAHFSSDDSIDSFWRIRDDERSKIWGKQVDLSAEAEPILCYTHHD